MNSGLATKSETGTWCKKVEFELDRFIFVAPKPLPEEEWTKLCEKYGEHQTRVLVGDALLIDLRGNEPKFESIPADFKGDFRQWERLLRIGDRETRADVTSKSSAVALGFRPT